jgi:hypothetical protein
MTRMTLDGSEVEWSSRDGFKIIHHVHGRRTRRAPRRRHCAPGAVPWVWTVSIRVASSRAPPHLPSCDHHQHREVSYADVELSCDLGAIRCATENR